MEVTAACVQNCFRKVGFVNVVHDVEPDASEENQSGGDLWQRVVGSDVEAMTLAETILFLLMTTLTLWKRAWTRAPFMNKSNGDETLEPAPISMAVAMGYIEGLREHVYAKVLWRGGLFFFK